MKKGSYESNIEKIDDIVNKLESGELSLEESLAEYEKAMKLLKETSDILNEAEGRVIKVSEDEMKNISFEEIEDV